MEYIDPVHTEAYHLQLIHQIRRVKNRAVSKEWNHNGQINQEYERASVEALLQLRENKMLALQKVRNTHITRSIMYMWIQLQLDVNHQG